MRVAHLHMQICVEEKHICFVTFGLFTTIDVPPVAKGQALVQIRLDLCSQMSWKYISCNFQHKKHIAKTFACSGRHHGTV